MLRFISFFFFKQKTAYEMRISDLSSDVCSSDLRLWKMPRGRRDRSNFGKGLGTLEYPSTMPSKRAADRSSLGTHDIARAPAQPALSSCGFTPVRPAHPVRAKDDGDGQVSWLAGQRRSAAFSGPGSQWHMADGSPRTVAGADRKSTRLNSSH